MAKNRKKEGCVFGSASVFVRKYAVPIEITDVEDGDKFEKRKKQIKNIEIKKCIGNKPL